MFLTRDRMEQEKRTIEAMIRIYCRGQHQGGDELCVDCDELLQYALARLDRCPFQEGKTTCAKCPVHCYKPDMREKIRSVMRYSGPRMLYRHPVLAVLHLIQGRRQKPVRGQEDRGRH
jgi:predicted amidophosphoribosyltransferase